MRKITLVQIATFAVLLMMCVALAAAGAVWFRTLLPEGDFRGILTVLVGAVLVYIFAFLEYRLFLLRFRLPVGEISPDSRDEFAYHVHLLFFLILFHPLIRSAVLPVPIMRLVYLALGARLGANTYSSGIIFDPILVQVGENSLIGQGALIVPHAVEGQHVSHFPIRIGANVTIGANAVLLQNVVVGDGAIVGVGAVVAKDTTIGGGEIWGGVPARRIGAARKLD